MTYSAIMTLLANRITYFIVIGLGAALGAYFVYLDREDDAIHTTYQQANCTIKAAEVTVDEQIHRTRGWGHYVTRTYYPEVTYTFKVNGTEYEGYDYRAFEGGMEETDALAVVERYEEGKTATCYYNPADPAEVVLSLDSDRRGMHKVGMWAVILLFAGLAGWVVIDFVLPRMNGTAKAAKQTPADFKVEVPA
jgi:hypothetical protein